MATITIENMSAQALFLRDLYTNLAVGERIVIDRPPNEVARWSQIPQLEHDGSVKVTIELTAAENTTVLGALLRAQFDPSNRVSDNLYPSNNTASQAAASGNTTWTIDVTQGRVVIGGTPYYVAGATVSIHSGSNLLPANGKGCIAAIVAHIETGSPVLRAVKGAVADAPVSPTDAEITTALGDDLWVRVTDAKITRSADTVSAAATPPTITETIVYTLGSTLDLHLLDGLAIIFTLDGVDHTWTYHNADVVDPTAVTKTELVGLITTALAAALDVSAGAGGGGGFPITIAGKVAGSGHTLATNTTSLSSRLALNGLSVVGTDATYAGHAANVFDNSAADMGEPK